MTLEQQLTELQTALTGHFAKAAEEQKARGEMDLQTKNAIEALQKQADAIDKKITEQNTKPVQKTLLDSLKESESIQRICKDKRGTAYVELPVNFWEQKTLITDPIVGFTTVGVLQSDRTPGIVAEARQMLKI